MKQLRDCLIHLKLALHELPRGGSGWAPAPADLRAGGPEKSVSGGPGAPALSQLFLMKIKFRAATLGNVQCRTSAL